MTNCINNFKDFVFRNATLEDAEYFFALRNDSGTRSQSINSALIELSDHLRWFEQKIQTKKEVLIVVSKEGNRVGYLREDTLPTPHVLSWVVDPKFRGRGYGKKILYEFVLSKKYPMSAIIHEGNIPSKIIASNAGFANSGVMQSAGFYIWKRN